MMKKNKVNIGIIDLRSKGQTENRIFGCSLYFFPKKYISMTKCGEKKICIFNSNEKKMTERRMKNAKRLLDKMGCDRVIVLNEDNGKKAEKKLFYGLSSLVYKSLSKDFCRKARLVIIDYNFEESLTTFINDLCFLSLNATVITKNIEKAEICAKKLWMENGYYLNILDKKSSINDFDAVFDTEKLYIRIGTDIIIKNFCFGYENAANMLDMTETELMPKLLCAGEKISFEKINGRVANFCIIENG